MTRTTMKKGENVPYNFYLITVDLKETNLTDFSEAFVFIDATVQGDGGVSGLLQKGIRRVCFLRVFLDGLQEEGVTGDPLHRHHQEETQRGGVYFRPEEINEQKKLQLNHQTLQVFLFFIQVFPFSFHKNDRNPRWGLDDSHDLVPESLLLFVAVLHHCDVVVVGQVFSVGRLYVWGQAEEWITCQERRTCFYLFTHNMGKESPRHQNKC